MKIIETRRAPNPRRVRIFLAEKGIEVPFEQVDLIGMEHRTPEFGGLNPMLQVPVLILDDGTAISETMAICRYFERVRPEPCLFGSGAKEEAVIEMWHRRAELGLMLAVQHVFRHLHPAMSEREVPQVPQWAEANRPRVDTMLRLFDAELARREFIAGSTFTIADITALVAIDFMKTAQLSRPEGVEHLDRWYNAVAARPSAAA